MGAVRAMINVLTAAMFFAASTGISFAQVKNAAAVETAAGKRSVASAFIDSRDGKKYRTVVIGGKRWMGENLNYETTSGSWCYKNDNSNCDTYGRLYDWKTAKTVCPGGWHLPSRQEWIDLGDASGGRKAGKKLKARIGWNKGGNGTDDYGFSAMSGGNRYYSGGSFSNVGNGGYWWTATEDGSGNAYNRFMYYFNDSLGEGSRDEGYGFSVRCVGD